MGRGGAITVFAKVGSVAFRKTFFLTETAISLSPTLDSPTSSTPNRMISWLLHVDRPAMQLRNWS